ncbi:hypothetical protein RF11_00455 [Thelohanellus kitauei]|uniref:Uncharacterized protein n=1 Tax=Thelohanellus kitauei TaxID=669202 RepID=A0A0C2MS86_THEKT|nr:hypothetical protein RF11_00455 [Thelohanellus kitauei]
MVLKVYFVGFFLCLKFHNVLLNDPPPLPPRANRPRPYTEAAGSLSPLSGERGAMSDWPIVEGYYENIPSLTSTRTVEEGLHPTPSSRGQFSHIYSEILDVPEATQPAGRSLQPSPTVQAEEGENPYVIDPTAKIESHVVLFPFNQEPDSPFFHIYEELQEPSDIEGTEVSAQPQQALKPATKEVIDREQSYRPEPPPKRPELKPAIKELLYQRGNFFPRPPIQPDPFETESVSEMQSEPSEPVEMESETTELFPETSESLGKRIKEKARRAKSRLGAFFSFGNTERMETEPFDSPDVSEALSQAAPR